MPLTYKQGSCGSNKKNRKEVLSAISEFFYYAGIPMQLANSLSFQKMLELVGHYGPGLTGPSSRQISGRFLHDELSTVKSYLVEYRTCWAVTGCSIMADSWKNSQGRILINFLVSCPRGVYFVYLVDATDVVDDPSSLFKLLDQVVEEIGEENVVQVFMRPHFISLVNNYFQLWTYGTFYSAHTHIFVLLYDVGSHSEYF